MSAVIKTVSKTPKAVVSETTQLVKETLKPANKHDIKQIAIGSVAGGLMTAGYNWIADQLFNAFPFQNPLIVGLSKALLPFGLSYLFYKVKMPFGNILSGGFLGVGIANVISYILYKFNIRIPQAINFKLKSPTPENIIEASNNNQNPFGL